MKLNNAKTNTIPKPFIDDGTVKITVNESKHRIVSFEAEFNGECKKFPVKNFKILEAWQQMEKFFAGKRLTFKG